MDALSKSLTEFFQTHSALQTIYIAYSGGLDSTVLLHSIARLISPAKKLCAIHINHNIHPDSEAWENHCGNVAKSLKIEFLSETLLFDEPPKKDLENTLRNLRYEIFAKYMDAGSILLTAHHQDDQAETLLLQLLRGAGPKGLSAMPVIKSFSKGWHARPFLSFSRTELLQYAKENHLTWIEDDSNVNIDFTRNFLRHEILPKLNERWPDVSVLLARSAEHCANTEKLLSHFLQNDLEGCAGKQPGTLSVEKLMGFDLLRRQYILRAWIMQHGFILPSQKKLQQITESVMKAGIDRQPHLSWGEVEVRRYRDDLYVMKKLPPHDATKIIPCEEKNKTIRFRQGGEKIQLPGRTHRHCLKKILQEKGIPPWLRDRVPLVYEGEVLVSVAENLDAT
ncbi:MAG: tRNA lysidine(34) synthetase TilS [Gammaproteobacteria bacterium]|nr:tRNA lysidine(34) synthetase TilS [Gammaproteobacteria bacterium]